MSSSEFQVSTRRWWVLLVFSLYGISNQLSSVAFATIVREVQVAFDVSSLEVNVISALFPLVYVAFVFPACSYFEHVGLRGGLLMGSAINAVGACTRIAAAWAPYFAILVVSQLMCAVSQLFFLSLPPLVASTWFCGEERTLATALGTLSGLLGVALGMFYGPQLLTSHATQGEFGIYFVSQAALEVAALVGIYVIVDASPPASPSVTAAGQRKRADSILPLLRRQLRDRSVLLLSLAFGLVNGCYTGLAAVLSQTMQPFGVDEDQTGVIGLVGIVGGSVMCGLVAPFVDRHRRYKAPLLWIYGSVAVVGTAILVCMQVISSASDFVPAAFALGILLEILVLPAIPIVLEFCVELTYPDPESVSASLAVSSLSFFSVVSIVVFGVVLGDSPDQSNSFTVVASLVALNIVSIGLVWVAVDERRVRFEHECSSLGGDSSSMSVPWTSTPNLRWSEMSAFS